MSLGVADSELWAGITTDLDFSSTKQISFTVEQGAEITQAQGYPSFSGDQG